jgi:hypothetical protein
MFIEGPVKTIKGTDLFSINQDPVPFFEIRQGLSSSLLGKELTCTSTYCF